MNILTSHHHEVQQQQVQVHIQEMDGVDDVILEG